MPRLTTKEHQTLLNRSQAHQRYKSICRGLNGIGATLSLPEDVLTEAGVSRSQLKSIRHSLVQANAELSHTYSLCPTCRKALTNRKFRKDSTKNYSIACAICGSNESASTEPYGYFNPINHTGHYKLSLKEARLQLSQTHPELLV